MIVFSSAEYVTVLCLGDIPEKESMQDRINVDYRIFWSPAVGCLVVLFVLPQLTEST